MAKTKSVMRNKARYSLGEVVSGILFSAVVILVFSVFCDIFIHGKTYNNYCCCNLEAIDDPFNVSDHESKTDTHNSFCILYNTTQQYTYFINRLPEFTGPAAVASVRPTNRSIFDEVKKIINKFKVQTGMNQNEFNLYLFLRNIPSYVIPNAHCYYVLERINLKEKDMKYSCIDLQIEE